MIARIWRGEAISDNAPRYVDHLEGSVFPKLERLSGHEGAYLLRRETNDRVEFVVLTLWATMEAIHQFAGDDPGVAVVEPAAREVLTRFDESVDHYEIVLSSAPTS
jgi:heme-degrading monooxygenase HmoA